MIELWSEHFLRMLVSQMCVDPISMNIYDDFDHIANWLGLMLTGYSGDYIFAKTARKCQYSFISIFCYQSFYTLCEYICCSGFMKINTGVKADSKYKSFWRNSQGLFDGYFRRLLCFRFQKQGCQSDFKYLFYIFIEFTGGRQ